MELEVDVIGERHHANASSGVGVVDVEFVGGVDDEVDELLEVVRADASRRVDREDDVRSDVTSCRKIKKLHVCICINIERWINAITYFYRRFVHRTQADSGTRRIRFRRYTSLR